MSNLPDVIYADWMGKNDEGILGLEHGPYILCSGTLESWGVPYTPKSDLKEALTALREAIDLLRATDHQQYDRQLKAIDIADALLEKYDE